MDLQTPPPLFPSQMEGKFEGNPFLDSSFPTANLRGVERSVTKRNSICGEGPSTPGRPIFSFSAGNFSRKSVPSKWDDAEKWVVNGCNSCHESPSHNHQFFKVSTKQCNNGVTPKEAFPEICRVTADEKVSTFHGASNGVSATSPHVLLKDKCTSEVESICPNFRTMKEGFLFKNMTEQYTNKEGFVFGDMNVGKSMKNNNNGTPDVALEIEHRDVGTEMTPLGSSTTSRCHTPFKSLSPAHHNTPASRSGPLDLSPPNDSSSSTKIDIAQLQECHFAKLQIGNTQHGPVALNWSSREEEEEEISKSLRHFEMNHNECRPERKAWPWEEEEKAKNCLRYQRELAKIQAWVNLHSAKTEAQSKKLEVKIQKMRSNLEEKLMKRMSIVHRKAEEKRATARLQHSEQMQKVSEQSEKKMMNKKSLNGSVASHYCSCFPCNNHLM